MVVPGMIMVMMINTNSTRVSLDWNLPSTNAMADPTSAASAIVVTDTVTEFRKFR